MPGRVRSSRAAFGLVRDSVWASVNVTSLAASVRRHRRPDVGHPSSDVGISDFAILSCERRTLYAFGRVGRRPGRMRSWTLLHAVQEHGSISVAAASSGVYRQCGRLRRWKPSSATLPSVGARPARTWRRWRKAAVGRSEGAARLAPRSRRCARSGTRLRGGLRRIYAGGTLFASHDDGLSLLRDSRCAVPPCPATFRFCGSVYAIAALKRACNGGRFHRSQQRCWAA